MQDDWYSNTGDDINKMKSVHGPQCVVLSVRMQLNKKAYSLRSSVALERAEVQ